MLSFNENRLTAVNSLLIADITSLQWRATVNGAVNLPYVLNTFVAGYISAGISANTQNGWRWGVSKSPKCLLRLAQVLVNRLTLVRNVLYPSTSLYLPRHHRPTHRRSKGAKARRHLPRFFLSFTKTSIGRGSSRTR